MFMAIALKVALGVLVVGCYFLIVAYVDHRKRKEADREARIRAISREHRVYDREGQSND